MSSESKVSKENLLSRSQEQADFQLALEEWEHTGKVVDRLGAIEICQLCEQPNLRYQFEIINRITKATLQVGSSCIEKFHITVYDSKGNELQGEAKSQKLKDEIAEKQQEMALEPLRELWEISKDEQAKIKQHVKEFKERGGFSPTSLLYLVKQMINNKIDYVPQIYKVLFRSNEDRKQLLSMSEDDKGLIWPSLSAPQRQQYVKAKKEFDEQQEVKRERQHQPDLVPVPNYPIRYIEKSHKFKITFYDLTSNPLHRVFRGNLNESKRYIEQEVKKHAQCTKADVRLTMTDELIETYNL